MKDKIFCIGRPIFDITVTIEKRRFKRLFEKFSEKNLRDRSYDLLEQLEKESEDFYISIGGAETNVAINCALLGLPSVLVGAIGKDKMTSGLRKYLNKRLLLNLELQTIENLHTGIVGVIWVKKKTGEKEKIKIIDYSASEYLKFTPSLVNILKSSTILFTSFYTVNSPCLKVLWKRAIKVAYKFNKKIVVDLGGINTVSLEERKGLLVFVNKYADMIYMNELEEKECYRIMKNKERKIKTIFPNIEIVVVTKAQSGALVYSKNREIVVKAIPLKFTNKIFPVGAGDAFISGFIVAINKGRGLRRSAQFASRIASLKIPHPSSHLLPEMLSKKISQKLIRR